MKLATTRARPRPAPAAAFLVRQNVAHNFNICNVPGSRLAGGAGVPPDDPRGRLVRRGYRLVKAPVRSGGIALGWHILQRNISLT
jgi:hypothetical protein